MTPIARCMQIPVQPQNLATAKNIAFRFLEVRPRSTKEIVDKLRSKGCTDSIVEQTITFLQNQKFLDDERFARDWVEYRLKQSYGTNRIILELKQKGIGRQMIENALSLRMQDYFEEQTVAQLAQKRAGRYKSLEPVKRKKRIFDYLARRGFTLELIKKAVSQI